MPTTYSIKGAEDFSCVPVNRDFLLPELLLMRFHCTQLLLSGMVLLWFLQVYVFEGISKNVTSVGFYENGQFMYSGGEDHTARIWDLRMG